MSVYNKINISSGDQYGDSGLGGNFTAQTLFVDYKYDLLNFFETTAEYTEYDGPSGEIKINHLAFNYKNNPDPTPGVGADNTFSFSELSVGYTPVPAETSPNATTDSFSFTNGVMTDNNEVVFSYLRGVQQNAWTTRPILQRYKSETLRVIITKHDGYVDVPPGEVGGNIGIKKLANWRIADILEFTIFETNQYTDNIEQVDASTYLLGNGNILTKSVIQFGMPSDQNPELNLAEWPSTLEKYIMFNKNFDVINTFYKVPPSYGVDEYGYRWGYSYIDVQNNSFTRTVDSGGIANPTTSELYDNNGNLINSIPFLPGVYASNAARFSNGKLCELTDIIVEYNENWLFNSYYYYTVRFNISEAYEDNGRFKIKNKLLSVTPGKDFGLESYSSYYNTVSNFGSTSSKWFPVTVYEWASSDDEFPIDGYYFHFRVYINNIFMGFYRTKEFGYSKPVGGWNLGRITF